MNGEPINSDSPTLSQAALKVAREAAIKAGEAIKRIRLEHAERIVEKSDGSHLTAGDLAAQEIVIAAIKTEFPAHAILSEEMTKEEQASARDSVELWVIDPIDGTTNYAYGSRQVGISIGFAREGKVIAGVVYNPFNDELFSAARGFGAALNGAPITIGTRAVDGMSDALIGTGFPSLSNGREAEVRRIGNVLRQCRDVRRAGACSLDLCDVACGRLDAYYESVQPWDMAAGGLIAREAGARVLNFETGADTELDGVTLLCARPDIVQQLNEILLRRS